VSILLTDSGQNSFLPCKHSTTYTQWLKHKALSTANTHYILCAEQSKRRVLSDVHINSWSGHAMLPAARLRDQLSVRGRRWLTGSGDRHSRLYGLRPFILLNRIIKGSYVVSCSDRFDISSLSKSHLRFCRTTLTHDKIAKCYRVTWCVAQLFNSQTTDFPNTAVLFYATLSRECAKHSLVGSCLCDRVAVCDMNSRILQLCRAIKLHDKIAGVALVSGVGRGWGKHVVPSVIPGLASGKESSNRKVLHQQPVELHELS